jgi:hypothetical protein
MIFHTIQPKPSMLASGNRELEPDTVTAFERDPNPKSSALNCVSGIIRYGVRFSAALPILDRHTAFEL